jgi:hypothetical protein
MVLSVLKEYAGPAGRRSGVFCHCQMPPALPWGRECMFSLRGHFSRLCIPSVIFAAAIAAAIVQA